MFFTLIKYIHIVSAIALVGSIFTIDVMTLKLILAREKSGLKIFYTESKFIERVLIGPGSLLTTISGIIMAQMWFGWPFWLTWGLLVVIITGLTGSITIPKLKGKLTDLISSDSADKVAVRKLTRKFISLISLDSLLLLSAVWTMVYKPVF